MSKTKAQLIDELEVMRQRIAVLEASGAERGQVLKELRIKDNAIASSINAIALSDLDGKLTYVNNSFLEMWGYESRDEVLGKSAIEFWKRKNQAGTVLEAVLKKKGARGELVAARKDGSTFTAELSASLVTNDDGKPLCVVGSFIDISERKRVEELLRKSEAKYRNLVESLRDVVYVIDDKGVVTYISPAVETFIGYTASEIINKSFAWYLHPDDVQRAMNGAGHVLSGESTTGEYRFITSSGEIRWMHTSNRPIFEGGRVVGETGILTDITERKQAEEALRESEDKYRSVVERASDLIVIIQDGEIRFVNKRGIEMLGYTPEEAVGTSTVKYIHPDAVELALNHYQRRMEGENVETVYDSALLHKDGRRVDVEVSGGLINYQGKPADLAILRDITERKRAEDALRDSEAKLRAMFGASPDFIMDADREGKLLFINRTVPELKPDEIPGTSLYDYLAPEVRDAYKETLAQVFQSGEPASIETAGLGPGGRTSYYRTRFEPVIHGDQVDTVIIVATDVTEYKRSEGVLRASEEKLRIIFESIGDAITVTDLEGNVLDANRAAVSIFGLKDKEEAIGRAGFGFIAERSFEKASEDLMRLFSEGSTGPVEYTFKTIDGREFEVESNNALLRDIEGNPLGFVSINRDISQRKQAEEALRTSEEKLHIMFDSITDGIVVTDLMGTIVDVNGAALSLHGYSDRQALVGRKGLDLISKEYQSVAIEKMLRALSEGHDVTMEYVISRPDGTAVDIQGVVNLLHDSGGNATGLVVITRDITERKRAEENLKLYVEEITKAQEEERKRIARDLHDETVQELAALTLDIEATKRGDRRLSEDTANALERIQEKARDIMNGVNRFSAELRPDVLDQMGLLSALSWLAENIVDEIDVRVEFTGDERRLPSEVELVLFRIAQEALSNVKKHSEAAKAMIKVAFTAGGVWLEVRDYGKGFILPGNIAEFATEGHLGILGMHERARIINGTFSVRSRPGEGTSVSIVV
jgi:PAS domain S-box-containing protein